MLLTYVPKIDSPTAQPGSDRPAAMNRSCQRQTQVFDLLVAAMIAAVPRGQWEAATSLWMTPSLTFRRIILPQALRAVIPALFNSFISLFKDTSLVAIIGLFEIVRISRSILAQSDWLGTHREVFLFAFIIYWAFNLAFTYGSRVTRLSSA